MINILAALCQFYDYDNSFETWDYYTNDDSIVTESMAVITGCSFVNDTEMDADEKIEILEVSLQVDIDDYQTIPSVEVSNVIYAVTDINTTSWSSLWDSERSSITDYDDYEYGYACEMYESNDIVSFICSNGFSTSSIAKPWICQASGQCFDHFNCQSNSSFILWTNDDGDSEIYVESEAYYLDAPYYEMNNMLTLYMIGDYPFDGNCHNVTEYVNKYASDDSDSTFDVSNTIVVVNTGPWCDDVEFIAFLQNEGTRAVILAQNIEDTNFSTTTTSTSTTIAPTTGTYLIASATLYMKNLTTITTTEMDNIMSSNSTSIIIEAYVELIDGYDTNLVDYWLHNTSNVTIVGIDFILKTYIEKQHELHKVEYSTDSSYASIVTTSLNYLVDINNDSNSILFDSVTINSITIEETVITTIDPENSDISGIYIPVRVIESENGYNFISKVSNDNDYTMEAKFGCESLSPTPKPTPDNYTESLATDRQHLNQHLNQHFNQHKNQLLNHQEVKFYFIFMMKMYHELILCFY